MGTSCPLLPLFQPSLNHATSSCSPRLAGYTQGRRLLAACTIAIHDFASGHVDHALQLADPEGSIQSHDCLDMLQGLLAKVSRWSHQQALDLDPRHLTHAADLSVAVTYDYDVHADAAPREAKHSTAGACSCVVPYQPSGWHSGVQQAICCQKLGVPSKVASPACLTRASRPNAMAS